MFAPRSHLPDTSTTIMTPTTTLASLDSRLDMAHAALDAIQRTQAVVEFDMKGHVLHANQNFLDAMGYTLAEIVGRHHRLFCAADYAASEAYELFWETLRSGHPGQGEVDGVGGAAAGGEAGGRTARIRGAEACGWGCHAPHRGRGERAGASAPAGLGRTPRWGGEAVEQR